MPAPFQNGHAIIARQQITDGFKIFFDKFGISRHQHNRAARGPCGHENAIAQFLAVAREKISRLANRRQRIVGKLHQLGRTVPFDILHVLSL